VVERRLGADGAAGPGRRRQPPRPQDLARFQHQVPVQPRVIVFKDHVARHDEIMPINKRLLDRRAGGVSPLRGLQCPALAAPQGAHAPRSPPLRLLLIARGERKCQAPPALYTHPWFLCTPRGFNGGEPTMKAAFIETTGGPEV